MDLSKFKTPDWLIIGGGLGILIFGFFDWLKVDVGPFGSYSGGNVFDFFFTGTVPWILLIGSAVVTVLLALEILKRDMAPWPTIILAATALAAILLLIRLLFNPGAPDGVGRAFGMFLSVLSGIVGAVGGFLNFQASGGDIKDLTDMDKLKSSFNQGGGGTPPPPPPGGSIPPPPPGGGTPPPPPPA